MTIGEILLEKRNALGVSRVDLSRSSGVDISVIWNIENGMTARPQNKTLVKIADALGIDISAFELENNQPHRKLKGYTPRYKECREAAGFSREDAAELFGVEEKTIYRWEVGKHRPTIYQLICMAKLYGVTLDYLINVDNVDDVARPPAPAARRWCKLSEAGCPAWRPCTWCCHDCPECYECEDRCKNDPIRCGQVKECDL